MEKDFQMDQLNLFKNYLTFTGADPRLVDRFVKFHEENPFVWQKFQEYAFKIKKTGKKKYSGWTIVNAIRWHFDLRTSGDSFKINNDFIALYVRLLINQYPEFERFFEQRKMKPINRKLSGEEIYRTKKGQLNEYW